MVGEPADEDAAEPIEIRSTGGVQYYDPALIEQEKLWVQTARRDPALADSIVAEIEELRRSRPHLDWQLASAIKYVLVSVGRWDDMLAFEVKLVDRYPEEVFAWTSLAHAYCLVTRDYEKAEQTIRHALDLARAQNYLVRYTLHDLARILVDRGDYARLCVTLEEIMATTPSPADIGRERDFIDRLPAGAIPSELLTRYNAFRPRRRSDRRTRRTKRNRADGTSDNS